MKRGIVVLVTAACLAIALTLVWGQTGQREVSLVITNGIVVTMDAAGRTIADGAVAVDGSDIVAVDSSEAIGSAVPGSRDDRCLRPDRDARAGEHPYARADGPVPRAG